MLQSGNAKLKPMTEEDLKYVYLAKTMSYMFST